MLLIIKDDNKIEKEVLSAYYKYRGITIYKSSNTYLIDLADEYSFSDNTKSKIVEYKKYTVINENESEPIHLYFYESDNGINSFELYELHDFYLSSNSETIRNYDQYSEEYYFELCGNTIESNFKELLVNHKKYDGQILKPGSFIEMLGFNIYYYEDFLYMNCFNVEIKIPRKVVEEKVIDYKKKLPVLKNYYESTKKGLTVNKIRNFEAPRKNNSRKIIFQIGPVITMSLAMIAMASINVYNTYLNNGSKLSIISLLIMPTTMLVSGILWPVIATSSDKRSYKKEYQAAKKEYLDYLKDYENELETRINDYLKEETNYVFNTNDIINRTFYINRKSKEFLNIFIGYQKKSIKFDYELTKDREIDEYLNRINYRLTNINNTPLFLNINNYKRITIISNNEYYFINRFILELIYKYHYDDIYVALYSRDTKLFNEVFSVPHMFYKQKRLTIIDERQLQDLNSYSLDKPLVLLLNDYSELSFSNSNIHVLYFTNTKTKILKNSDCVIEFNNNTGYYNGKENIAFKYYEEKIDFNKYYSYISLFNSNKASNQIISFKDIYPSINVVNNYINNKIGLKANFATINNDVLAFDLHESKDGPHGLIGGSTGSGKSELIISLLLSLAVNYSPSYLNIILIDYKGGGVKESLSYNNVTIPHIIAAINNLENDTFERLIVSIARECKKRQLLFEELSKLSSSSIMNIDEYLDINKEYHLEVLAHLLIVVDEFAELKKENPEIIKELISFSRIGRSLGIHLILATQRPNGVIDEEIWSNSHFKIALKMHSEKDSQDIIKTKDAAYLNNPGEFYLQEDDNIIKAKSLYAKRDINNNDKFEVCFLDNRLEAIKKKTYKKEKIYLESKYLTSKIIDATSKLGIKQKSFDYIKPEPLLRVSLQEKYTNSNELIMGEIDDYLYAKKGLLEFKLDENILIYSNRNKEINNIINTLSENKYQTIIISNQKYESISISDSLLYQDEEDIRYLFNKLLNDSRNKIKLIIEDINSLLSYDEDYINYLYQLVRRSAVNKYSLVLISKQSNVNFKLLNSIKNRLAIEIYDSQDVVNIFGTKGNYQGKSYFFKDQPTTFIPCIVEDIKTSKTMFNNYIDYLPKDIKYEYTRDHLLIGYDKLSRKHLYISDNDLLLITSYDEEIINKYKYLYIQNSNVKVALYNNELVRENYQNIIWFGDGIYSQRIFYIDKEIEMLNNEAYYYRANKGRIILPVNYE